MADATLNNTLAIILKLDDKATAPLKKFEKTVSDVAQKIQGRLDTVRKKFVSITDAIKESTRRVSDFIAKIPKSKTIQLNINLQKFTSKIKTARTRLDSLAASIKGISLDELGTDLNNMGIAAEGVGTKLTKGMQDAKSAITGLATQFGAFEDYASEIAKNISSNLKKQMGGVGVMMGASLVPMFTQMTSLMGALKLGDIQKQMQGLTKTFEGVATSLKDSLGDIQFPNIDEQLQGMTTQLQSFIDKINEGVGLGISVSFMTPTAVSPEGTGGNWIQSLEKSLAAVKQKLDKVIGAGIGINVSFMTPTAVSPEGTGGDWVKALEVALVRGMTQLQAEVGAGIGINVDVGLIGDPTRETSAELLRMIDELQQRLMVEDAFLDIQVQLKPGWGADIKTEIEERLYDLDTRVPLSGTFAPTFTTGDWVKIQDSLTEFLKDAPLAIENVRIGGTPKDLCNNLNKAIKDCTVWIEKLELAPKLEDKGIKLDAIVETITLTADAKRDVEKALSDLKISGISVTGGGGRGAAGIGDGGEAAIPTGGAGGGRGGRGAAGAEPLPAGGAALARASKRLKQMVDMQSDDAAYLFRVVNNFAKDMDDTFKAAQPTLLNFRGLVGEMLQEPITDLRDFMVELGDWRPEDIDFDAMEGAQAKMTNALTNISDFHLLFSERLQRFLPRDVGKAMKDILDRLSGTIENFEKDFAAPMGLTTEELEEHFSRMEATMQSSLDTFKRFDGELTGLQTRLGKAGKATSAVAETTGLFAKQLRDAGISAGKTIEDLLRKGDVLGVIDNLRDASEALKKFGEQPLVKDVVGERSQQFAANLEQLITNIVASVSEIQGVNEALARASAGIERPEGFIRAEKRAADLSETVLKLRDTMNQMRDVTGALPPHLASLSGRLDELSKVTDGGIDSIEKLQVAREALRDLIQNEKKDITDLSKSRGEGAKVFTDLTKVLKVYQKEQANVEKAIKKHNKDLRKAGKGVGDLGKKSEGASESLSKLPSALKNVFIAAMAFVALQRLFSAAAQRQQLRISARARLGIGGTPPPAGTVVGATAEQGAQFTEKDIAIYDDVIRRMTTINGLGYETIGIFANIFTQAKKVRGEFEGFMEVTADLAVAYRSFGLTENAVVDLSNSFLPLRLNISQTRRVLDSLLMSMKKTKFDAEGMGAALGIMRSLFIRLGGGDGKKMEKMMRTASGALAVLGKQFLTAGESADLLMSLTEPTKIPQLAGLLGMSGVEVWKMQQAFAKGGPAMADQMEKLHKAMASVTDEMVANWGEQVPQVLGIASDAFWKFWGGVRKARKEGTFEKLMEDNRKTIIETANATGTLETAADAQRKSVANMMRIISESIREVGATLGTTIIEMMPIIKGAIIGVVEVVADLIKGFNALPPFIKNVLGTLLMFGAVIVPIMAVTKAVWGLVLAVMALSASKAGFLAPFVIATILAAIGGIFAIVYAMRTKAEASFQEGGIATRRMTAEVGEVEPEAIIPLSKLPELLGRGGDASGVWHTEWLEWSGRMLKNTNSIERLLRDKPKPEEAGVSAMYDTTKLLKDIKTVHAVSSMHLSDAVSALRATTEKLPFTDIRKEIQTVLTAFSKSTEFLGTIDKTINTFVDKLNSSITKLNEIICAQEKTASGLRDKSAIYERPESKVISVESRQSEEMRQLIKDLKTLAVSVTVKEGEGRREEKESRDEGNRKLDAMLNALNQILRVLTQQNNLLRNIDNDAFVDKGRLNEPITSVMIAANLLANIKTGRV